MKNLDTIYFAARELPLGERPAYLDQACKGDLALKSRVEQMLAVATEAEAFISDLPDHESEQQKPGPKLVKTIKLDLADALDETVGQKIGRYKILERVGEGGCGVVYVAEQTEPVRRRVALKVIKLGMDTKQVVARFEAERQALAMMDHPNIAKVLDAGSTETGRPYFVMELVRGIRITDYCDQAQLSTKERLDLFIQVCHAIQHAHQKGIIHRDIKPSNILVTLHDGVPVPKVIDFGIAKATEGRLTDATVYTQLHQFIGTPAYMSPEQAEMSGLDIDTRSDIYALGVLLYEFLAGSTPFDAAELMSQGIDAMRKIIREKEPARPSTRFATLAGDESTTTARRRSTDKSKLMHQLKGDLDWIVMKCLEKNRTRRYETANGLAMDLQRHLDNEPVVARPPSAADRFQKSFHRNKLAFAATGAVMGALALGMLTTTWQAMRSGRAERKALTEQARAVAAEADERVQREQALINEKKAVAAQATAQEALYDALVGQARATRLARRVGYRAQAFTLLGQAKALDVPRRNLTGLLDEATECLGDFTGLPPTTMANFPANLNGVVCLSPSGKLAAFGLADGTIQLRDGQSGKEVARLAAADAKYQINGLCFNSAGDECFAICWPRATNSAQFCDLLPQHRLRSWISKDGSQWQQLDSSLLPGVMKLNRNGNDVFAFVVSPTASGGSEAKSISMNVKLVNIATKAIMAGCNLSNVNPESISNYLNYASDGKILAVGRTLYDWQTGLPIKN